MPVYTVFELVDITRSSYGDYLRALIQKEELTDYTPAAVLEKSDVDMYIKYVIMPGELPYIRVRRRICVEREPGSLKFTCFTEHVEVFPVMKVEADSVEEAIEKVKRKVER